MTDAAFPWRGPAQFAGIAFAAMIFVMWVTRVPPTCDMASEPARYIDLARVVDREHVAADIQESGRIARRYSAHMADTAGAQAGPGGTQTFDARAQQCEAILARQIGAMHNVTLDQIRRLTATQN